MIKIFHNALLQFKSEVRVLGALYQRAELGEQNHWEKFQTTNATDTTANEGTEANNRT